MPRRASDYDEEAELPDDESVDQPTEEEAPEPEQQSAEPETTAPAPTPESVFPLADPGPYYSGLWGKHPNYSCPYCGYATLSRGGQDGNGLVELHILERIDQGDVAHMAALSVKEA